MNSAWWVNLQQLDEHQRRVINLPADGNYLVLGPPGSGKTNLMLLRGNYLVKAGFPNLMVVVFTRTLKEFIVQGGDRYSFAPQKVTTSMRWQYDLLRQFGGEVPTVEMPFEQARLELLERVRAMMTSRKLDRPFDAVLIDEAQDYLPEEIEVFAKLGRRIFAVADSRQQIYQHRDGLDVLEQVCSEKVELRFHYRNGRSICRFADALAAHTPLFTPLLPTCNYDENRFPSSVETVVADTIAQQADHIVEKIEVQLKAYPAELLGVVCPRRVDVDAVGSVLERSSFADVMVKQSFEEGYTSFTDATRVCLCTIHGSKGLEFRTVHAAGCDRLVAFPMQRNLAFTLATRAKTSLNLYASRAFPGYIEQAMVAAAPPPELPPIESAFGEAH